MSHSITIQLSDEEFAPIRRIAEATRRSPAEVIVAALRANPLPFEAADQSKTVGQGMDFTSLVGEVAVGTGQTEDEILARWRGPQDTSQHRHATATERQTDLDDLLAFAGVLRGDDPFSSNNDRIDADLAREYGATHEDEV